MLGDAGSPKAASPTELQPALDELQVIVQRIGDNALGGAMLAARQAANCWRDQVEQLAFHQRALAEATESERLARERVRLVLDLATSLAALQVPPSPDVPTEHASEPSGAARTTGSGRHSAPDRTLTARLLGSFEIDVDGSPISEWRGRRCPAVLQYLISRRCESVDREVLIEALWPEINPDAGRRRLHQAVYALRQALHQVDPGYEHIVCVNGSYRINPAVTLAIDVDDFDRLAAAGAHHDAGGRPDRAFEALRAADRLYRGDYLEGSAGAEWAAPERERLRASFVTVGVRLAARHAEVGDHNAALAACARVLARDPWNEEAMRRAMQSHAAVGNGSHALRLFRSFEALLGRELGVSPSVETLAVYDRLLTACGRTATR